MLLLPLLLLHRERKAVGTCRTTARNQYATRCSTRNLFITFRIFFLTQRARALPTRNLLYRAAADDDIGCQRHLCLQAPDACLRHLQAPPLPDKEEEEEEGDEEDAEEEEENNGHAYGGADGRTEGRATERQSGDDRRLELCMPITYASFMETYYRFLGGRI